MTAKRVAWLRDVSEGKRKERECCPELIGSYSELHCKPWEILRRRVAWSYLSVSRFTQAAVGRNNLGL